MGVKYAHQLTHSVSGLSLSRFELIAQSRFALATNDSTIIRLKLLMLILVGCTGASTR